MRMYFPPPSIVNADCARIIHVYQNGGKLLASNGLWDWRVCCSIYASIIHNRRPPGRSPRPMFCPPRKGAAPAARLTGGGAAPLASFPGGPSLGDHVSDLVDLSTTWRDCGVW